VPDGKRFPYGMLELSRYVHGLGLKFGIYGDYGTATCEKYPGSQGYEAIDAQTFGEWEIDYLKFDGCHSSSAEQRIGYEKFGNELDKTGRKIVYSCSYPAYLGGSPRTVDYTWLGQNCHQWRNYLDIDDSWYSVIKIIEWFGDNNLDLRPFTGPGRWHDPDMLVVGNYGLSDNQGMVQMSMWCIMGAPLIMSNDLRDISDVSKEILTNRDAIFVNQDRLGIPGYRIGSRTGFELWAKPLENEKIAITAFSIRADGVPKPFVFRFDYFRDQIKNHFEMAKWYKIKDVWQNAPGKTVYPVLANVTDSITVFIRPMSCFMWILEPVRGEHNMGDLSHDLRARIRDSL